MSEPYFTLPASGSWAERFGYSRAIRRGSLVVIAGTTASGVGGPVGGADVAEQMREALARVERAVIDAGGKRTDIIRTRVFLTSADDLVHAGEVHGAFFTSSKPVTTIVVVSALADPALLVEVEADAVIS